MIKRFIVKRFTLKHFTIYKWHAYSYSDDGVREIEVSVNVSIAIPWLRKRGIDDKALST